MTKLRLVKGTPEEIVQECVFTERRVLGSDFNALNSMLIVSLVSIKS